MDAKKIQKTNLIIKRSKFKNTTKEEKPKTTKTISKSKNLQYSEQNTISLMINQNSVPLRVPARLLKKRSESFDKNRQNAFFTSINLMATVLHESKTAFKVSECVSNKVRSEIAIEEGFNENSLEFGSIPKKSSTYLSKSRPVSINVKSSSQWRKKSGERITSKNIQEVVEESSTRDTSEKSEKRKRNIRNKAKEKGSKMVKLTSIDTIIVFESTENEKQKVLRDDEQVCTATEAGFNQNDKGKFQDIQYAVTKNVKASNSSDVQEVSNSRQFFSPSKHSFAEVTNVEESVDADKERKRSKRLKKGKNEEPRRLIMKDFAHYEELIIKESRIHGRGIFTPVDIEVNTLIMEYKGEIIGKCMSNKREKLYKKNKIDSIYMFSVSDDMIIDATMLGNKARYINHSCNPNCEAIHSMIDKSIKYCSIRDISAGEELTINYNMSQESNGETCNCGDLGCISNNDN